MVRYFTNIYEAVSSAVVGMGITRPRARARTAT